MSGMSYQNIRLSKLANVYDLPDYQNKFHACQIFTVVIVFCFQHITSDGYKVDLFTSVSALSKYMV